MRKLLLWSRLIKRPIVLIGQVGLFIILTVTAAFAQPANDNFDDAAMLVGSAGTFGGSTTGATREPGEPNHWTYSGSHSVWHRWIAPYDGWVSFDTVGSYFDTVLAVYTGTNVSALTLIANNDDYATLDSKVTFNAVAGTQYMIAVDGYSSSQYGLYILNWHYETQQTNPPAPPLGQNQIQFAQDTYTVQENTPGFVKIYVNNGGGNTAPISVNYATSNGTAIAGVDYIEKSGQLTFQPGETNKAITVQILDNAVANTNKNFSVSLFNPSGGASLGQLSNTVVTITDDETVPYTSTAGELQFSASLYRVTELESNTRPGGYRSIPGALVVVNRLNGSTGRILVDYVVTNAPTPIGPPSTNLFQVHPAQPFYEYLPATGTLVFDDGQTSTNFVVRTPGGNTYGLAEVSLYLSNPRPAPEEDPALIVPRLGNQSNAVVQIVDIDGGYGFCFERLNSRVDEGNRSITVRIYLFGAAGGRVGLRVVSPNNRNGNISRLSVGSDYAINGVDCEDVTADIDITIPPGYKDITLPILDDSLVEFNEDVILYLVQLSQQPPVHPYANYTTVTILYDEQPPGAEDREWNPDRVPYTTPPFNLMPGANNQVYSVAVQPDDKAVIGGDFTAVNTIPRNRIARFNQDGSLDTNFVAHPNSGADGFVSQVIVIPTNMPDANKIIIAGGFTSFNGYLRNGIARLLPDGSPDMTFSPGSGANAPIWGMALQSDGRIIIAGEFTTFNDKPRAHIARLNADGSLDMTFNPLCASDGIIWNVSVFEGTPGYPLIYIGGDFSIVNGEQRKSIARLNPDGTLDYSFNPGTGSDGPVYAIAVQRNGAAIIGGSFTEIDSKPRNNIARLNPNGTLDLTFNPGFGPNDAVYSIILRPLDDRAYIGGKFTSYNQTRRMGMALLRPDGTLDTTFMDTGYNQFAGLIKTFNFEPNHFVRSIALQADGNLMIGGSFTNIGGNFARYLNNIGDYSSVWTRQDKVVRMNVARLIGTWGSVAQDVTVVTNGVTNVVTQYTTNASQGPGNIEFITDDYYIDENQSVMNITLMRVEGDMGTAGAATYTTNRLAVAGSDYGMTTGAPLFTEWYRWMRSQGYPGPVYVRIPIIDDNIIEGNETVDLGLYKPFGQVLLGGEFVPLAAALGRTFSTLTIVDNDFEHGVLAFSAPSYITNENATNIIVTVIRTNGANGTVSVDYYTKNGSAVAGAGQDGGDYTAVRGTLTFAAGVTERTITIPLFDDYTVEFDETFYVVLTNATGGAKLPGGTDTSFETTACTIIDNDFPAGRLNFSTTNYLTSEGDNQIVVTVTRTGGNLGPLAVSVVTSNGSAVAGADFVYTSNRLSWVHNETTAKSVVIPILDDALVEGTETFKVNLVSPSVSGSIGSMGSATVNILDDDSYGAFQFSQQTYSTDENGTNLTITVVRVGGSAGAVSVNYATSDGSAFGSVHYIPKSGVLNFAAGEVIKTFSVQAIDNSLLDGDKIFSIVLSNPQGGATLGSITNAQVVIVDDESSAIPAGSIDTSFTTGTGPNLPVHSILIQPDGYIIIGGEFTLYNNIIRRGIARIDSIGRIDPSFDVGDGFNEQLRAMALQPDGRIVIGGFFTTVNGINRNRIARLNKDGTVDTYFNPGAGADSPIYAMAVQSDGRILVGGSFNTFNGVAKPGLVRLNTNGTINTGFDVGAGVDGNVYAIAIQGDGKILIGGNFARVNLMPLKGIARLNPNGSVDTTFNPGLGIDGAVRAIVAQPDGKIIIGGSFTNFNGQSCNYIVRLNKDGSLDPTFMPGELGADEAVYAIALQSDNKILVAGSFTRFNGVTRNRITRLNPDGTTDPSINFGEGANGFITALAVQTDRKIITGGGFTMIDGKPRNHLARLHGGSLAGSGTLQFSTPYYIFNEDEPVALLTVLRGGGTFGTVSALYATADGSAVADLDYTAVTNRVVFPPGEVMQTIRVPIINDTLVEDTESFYVFLDDATGGADIGIVPVATVSIASDDCIVGFSSMEYTVSEGAPNGFAKITITRQGSTNGTVSVDCSAVSNVFGPNPAVPNVDFLPATETLVFQPGVTSLVFNAYITNDFEIEPAETVLLQLSNIQPANSALPGITNAILTILDDDFSPGVVQFMSTEYSVVENRGEVVITLIRTNGSSGMVSVKMTSANGTAVSGLDYQAINTTIAFADGETVKKIAIPILNDTDIEPDELFYVYLSGPFGGVALGANTMATIKIFDDDFAPSFIRFSETNYVVEETQTNAVITVLRFGNTNASISVDYFTYGMTAISNKDYLDVSGTLNWAAGDEQPKTFLIPVLNDPYPEVDELINIVLTNVSGGVAVQTPTAMLTIVDDDIRNYGTNGVLNYGANNTVRTIAFAPDQNLYIGGDFTIVNGMIQNRLARLTTNSIVDTSFTIGSGFNNSVDSMLLSANGELIVGGDFTTYNGQRANRIIVLDTNGIPIQRFNPTSGANGRVRTIALDMPSNFTFSAYSLMGVTNMHTNTVDVGTNFGTLNLTYFFYGGVVAPGNTNAAPIYTNTLDIVYGSNMFLLRTNILVQSNYVTGNIVLNFGPSAETNLSVIVNSDWTNGSQWSYTGNIIFGSAADRRIYIGGDFSVVGNSGISRIARLLPSGNVDLSFNPGIGPNDTVYSIAVYTNGQVLVAGAFTSYNGTNINRIARLYSNGMIDSTFNSGIGANGTIRKAVIQSDGRILIAGDFSTISGVPRNGVARLNSDGSIDLTFNPDDGANGIVRSIDLLTDGRIIVGGDFTEFNHNSYNRVVRLNGDGSVDTSFNVGKGANDAVYAVAVTAVESPLIVMRQSQMLNPTDVYTFDTGTTYGTLTIDYDFTFSSNSLAVYYDGMPIFNFATNGVGTFSMNFGPGQATYITIVVSQTDALFGWPWNYTATVRGGTRIENQVGLGGKFTYFNGEPRGKVTVLRETGSLSSEFYPHFNPKFAVYSLGIYTNVVNGLLAGKVIVGGDSTGIVGVNYTNLARIDRFGLIDTNFNLGLGPNGDVRAIAIQPDTSVLVGGSFTYFITTNLIRRTYIAKILTNGVIDPLFNDCDCYNGPVNSIVLQPDGKILVGGAFTLANGAKRNGIARLHPDGTIDLAFNPGSGVNGLVNAVALQGDGKVLVGGQFTTYNEMLRKGIVRVNSDGSLDSSFNPVDINGVVRAVVVARDGKILIGGSFSITNYNAYGIARLNSDGSLDLTFNPGVGVNDYISTIAINKNDKIIIAGAFTMFNNQIHNRIVRLNADGSIDPTISFGEGANNFINSVILDEDNDEIVIGGGFSEFNGQVYYGVGRVSGAENLGPGVFQFASASYEASENSNEVAIPIIRNYGATGSVAVNFRTVDGTAIAGVDYKPAAGLIEFAEGEVIKYIRISLIDNQTVSPNRLFNIQLFNATGGADIGMMSLTSVGILENDSVVGFESQEFNVVEGVTNARITVVRNGGVEGTVSVIFTTGTNGTAQPYYDYLPVNAGTNYDLFSRVALVFNPGIQRMTVNIPIIDDFIPELTETVSLGLTDLSGAATLGLSNAVLKIIDNDVNPGVISFATNYFTVIENFPTAIITVIRTNGYSGVVSVDYTVGIGGSATAGQDYIATNGVVTFAENETVKTFAVRILDDNTIEGNETVLMKLSRPVGGATLGTDTAVLAINDDDSAGGFVFGAPEFVVSEGAGNAVVEVKRVGGNIGQVSVTVMSVGGTATLGVDYIGISNVLNFASGETNKLISIPIIDDAIVEMPETIGLILQNPSNGSFIGAQGSANVVIIDNEVGISLANQSYSVSETGAVAVINVLRIGNTNISVSTRYNTSDGTAIAGSDYRATNGVLTFAPGQTNQYIVVPIIDDTLAESDEVFNITLSGQTPGVSLGPIISAPVVIVENDKQIFFSAPTYTIEEAYTNITITVLRSGNTNDIVTVDYNIQPGTATPLWDYYGVNGMVEMSGTLTFGPGQTSNSFSLYILDDYIVEGPETINLSLVNPTGGAVIGAQGTAIVIIQDNDSSVSFASTNYVAAEKSTNAVITLIRRGIATGEVSVAFSTTNLTAYAGQDYVYTSNLVKWASGDMSPKTVLVPLMEDSIVEGAEQVALLLSNPSIGTMIDTNFATLTIVDDAGVIAFSSQSYRVNESQVYAVINLIRSGGSNGVVSVDYSVSGGTATAGVDYTNSSGTIVFANGEVIKSILIPVVDDGIIEGPETVLLSLNNPQGGALIGSPNKATLTIYDSQLGMIDPAGTALIAEGITPANNVIDPNETVTVSFGLRNSGFISTTNLVATLLPGNGVINIRTNTQTYGVLSPAGAAVARPFTFTATGTNGSIITARFQLSDNGANLGIVSFSLIIGKVPNQFCNATAVVINDNTNATPYPSVINVSGVIGVVSKITVTLNGLSHSYPSDIDILLVSPDGRKSILMSDAGTGFAINNATLTFDADAAAFLPENGQIISGVYKPTNYLAADVFPPSAPSGPYTTDLSVFNGINPNGYWYLYVVDDDRGDSGVISGGWCLTLVTTEGVLPSPDLTMSMNVAVDSLNIGGDLTYTISVTNRSAVVANDVIVNDLLPEGVALISVSNPYGQVATNMNLVSAFIGAMQGGANAVITIKAKVSASPDVFVNRAWVYSSEQDSNLADNSAITRTIRELNLRYATTGDNKNISFKWPVLNGEWIIETATELNGVWTPLTNAPSLNGDYYQLTVPIEFTGNQFYRLRKK